MNINFHITPLNYAIEHWDLSDEVKNELSDIIDEATNTLPHHRIETFLNQDEKDYLVMATPYIFEVFDTLSEKAVQELNSFVSEF
jgi:hypothetical protein